MLKIFTFLDESKQNASENCINKANGSFWEIRENESLIIKLSEEK